MAEELEREKKWADDGETDIGLRRLVALHGPVSLLTHFQGGLDNPPSAGTSYTQPARARECRSFYLTAGRASWALLTLTDKTTTFCQALC